MELRITRVTDVRIHPSSYGRLTDSYEEAIVTMTTVPDPVAVIAVSRTTTVRYVQATAFVAVWMVLGWLLRPGPEAYLLIGVPLTVAFQLLVRRQPLRALWVRAAPAFRLDGRGVVVAVLLALLPMVVLVESVVAGQWATAGWSAACVVGASAAAFALRRFRRSDTRVWLHWIAVAAVPGIAFMVIASVLGGPPAAGAGSAAAAVVVALQTMLLLLPVQFVLEEVSFRGLLDTHVHDRHARRGWPSALFISALWGLWHLPLAPAGAPLIATIGQLLLVHCAVGVGLSYGWRHTGNLAVPALAHGLVDAVRDALLVV